VSTCWCGVAVDCAYLLHGVEHVSDSHSRIFQGTFECVDKECNVVLSRTDEFVRKPDAEAVPANEGNDANDDALELKRKMNVVMVPGKYIKQIDLVVPPKSEADDADSLGGLDVQSDDNVSTK